MDSFRRWIWQRGASRQSLLGWEGTLPIAFIIKKSNFIISLNENTFIDIE
jgi:hypothetical protein